jgi:hypothetical protein
VADPVALDDRCPRCGGAFHCGAADPGPCACTTVRLDAATLATLQARYSGCLCLRCLADVAAGAAVGDAPAWRTMPACATRSP